ncbi:MAG: tyrosine-type recombinase/integrase, partial [Nitrospirota bacterium]|nr:tyrosine-type recombinase/integrase [Nitrospirota bacterium]MDX2420210.1 tyrosine-type recombinase/integrase [Nitrospirota bacterium]
KKASIQDASWHTLRHTTASRLVMAGVPLPTVKEVLGHRDIQTTLRYAHLAPSHIQAAMEKGSLANLGLGTGSTTWSDVTSSEEKKTQVVDLIGAPDWT